MNYNSTVLKFRETERKMTLSTKLSFGKYRNITIYMILNKDVNYVRWLLTIWDGEVDQTVSTLIKKRLN